MHICAYCMLQPITIVSCKLANNMLLCFMPFFFYRNLKKKKTTFARKTTAVPYPLRIQFFRVIGEQVNNKQHYTFPLNFFSSSLTRRR
uniref:Uncharacterized protein n=1 Tax=Rhizophora mucronata TaxID=61149 RepID=A0A2P2KXJ9_RHIMU